MTELPAREGFVDVPGGRVWYKIVGDGPGVPLVFDNSAHMAHMEEAGEYAAVLRQFLRETEDSA